MAPPPDWPVWTTGPQAVPIDTEEQATGWLRFAGGLGVVGAFGSHRFKSGKRGWDHIIAATRAVEEYSPGRVFRTFQLSHLLSPLEQRSREFRYFSPESLTALRGDRAGRAWLKHLSRLTGRDFLSSGVIGQGFRYEDGRLLLGRTGGDVLLQHAGVVRSPTGSGARFQEAYARSLAGGPLGHLEVEAFRKQIGFEDLAGAAKSEIFMFTGGRSRFQATGRYLAGYGTSLVERFNQLARAPFELPILSGILNRLPVVKDLHFAVEPSSGLKTLGKLTAKIGLLGYGIYTAFNWIDYQTRELGILDETLFDEGIYAAGATLWTRGMKAVSTAAEWTGLHSYREWQEEAASGSTELTKLLAFPILGAMGGLGHNYIKRALDQVRLQRAGLSLEAASNAITLKDAYFKQAIYKSKIPQDLLHGIDEPTLALLQGEAKKKILSAYGQVARKMAQVSERGEFLGSVAKTFGKLTPSRIRWMAGAAVGTALILPFLPGALVPSERPEELEALYSGRQRVPIRKGRWWEFGRCNTAESLIKNGFGKTKKARDLNIGDKVITQDGSEAEVLDKFERDFNGLVFRFITPLDRDPQAWLTGNHILPVLRGSRSYYYDKNLKRNSYLLRPQLTPEEIEAESIKPGDFVEVPIPQLPTNCTSISTSEYLNFPIWIDKDRVFSSQKNWSTQKPQKSGKYSIPKDLVLDYDLGLLFGYFLAEGNLSFRNDSPSFIETVHSIEEENIRDNVIRIAREKFGVRGTYRYKKDGPRAKEGYWVVRLCSSILAKLFLGLFYEEPYNAENKTIPLVFLSAVNSFKRGLIKGYQEGDGHLDRDRSIISSSRPWLLNAIKEILLSLGYLPTQPNPEDTGYIKKDGRESIKYKIEWNEKDRYKNQIRYFIKFNGRLFCRVEKVESKEYEGKVYDFEIDHPSHLYQSGSLLVHNSPYEGTGIKYFSPHWYPRMLSRYKEKAIWGEDVPDPYEQWWTENVTYELEKKHYFDRPYPITGTFGEDIPFIGPLIGATIGRLIKPPRLMHTNEWMRGGGGEGEGEAEYLRPPFKFGESELPGEAEVGAPISPYSAKGVIGKQIYNLQEMVGLPGFTTTAIKEAITGTPDVFDQEMQLESASKIYSPIRQYWDIELGGALGLCFTSDSLVTTPEGRIPISKIDKGDLVLSNQGFYQTVNNVFTRSYSGALVSVYARGMGIKITGTPNHKIPIIRRHCYNSQTNYKHPKPFQKENYDLLELPMIELRKGDWLLYPIQQLEKDVDIDLKDTGRCFTDRYVYTHASYEFAKAYELLEAWGFIDRSTRKSLRELGCPDLIAKEVIRQFRLGQVPHRINRFIAVSEEVASVIGWYLAEGSSDETKVQFVMHADEAEYANEIFDVFRNLGFCGQIKVENNSLVLRIYSSQLARYFRRFGVLAPNKKIPPEFLHLPKPKLKKLIDALILGDGWSPTGRWKGGFGSTSEELVRNLADCLLKFDEIPYITLNYLEKANGYYPQGTKRKDCLRNYLRHGRDRWRLLENYFLVPVSSVEITELSNDIKVYDLEVEDTHHYTISGVLVHNSELQRRLFPHERRQVPRYNPIRNQMPQWLPGPGERSEDFLHGDAYAAIPRGEMRLPGPGYAAIHPELEGVDPADYPLIYRFAILADVASYTEKFKEHLIKVRAARKRGELTEQEEQFYLKTMEEVQRRKKRKTFYDYKYRGRAYTPWEKRLAEAEDTEEPGLFARMFGSYWETLVHKAETPFEFLTPISPASKLIHMRTAIEDYEKTQIYGTKNAFWGHPVRDFFSPFASSTYRALGGEGIPGGIQERRELEEYFDILKYVKYTRLKRAAQSEDDRGLVKEYEDKRRETLFGINPYTYNFSHIYRSLPRRDRDYFNEFVEADVEERREILNLIPENEKALMLARWELEDANDIKQAVKKGLLDDDELEVAQQQLEDLYEAKDTEGFPKNKELWVEYIATRLEGEGYADWYRRVKLLEKKLEGRGLPGPDWVGWNPMLDLDDVKLKIVQQEGKNTYDYDIWPDQIRAAVRREPLLEEAVEELREAETMTPGEIRKQVEALMKAHNIDVSHIVIRPSGRSDNSVNFEIEEDRTEDIRNNWRRR